MQSTWEGLQAVAVGDIAECLKKMRNGGEQTNKQKNPGSFKASNAHICVLQHEYKHL